MLLHPNNPFMFQVRNLNKKVFLQQEYDVVYHQKSEPEIRLYCIYYF